MLSCGRMDATGTVGGGTAPDALVRTGAVAMLAGWRVDAARTVGGRTTPLAMLLIVTMLVFLRRRMDATGTVARAAAMSAFSCHEQVLHWFDLPRLKPPRFPVSPNAKSIPRFAAETWLASSANRSGTEMRPDAPDAAPQGGHAARALARRFAIAFGDLPYASLRRIPPA